MGKRKQVILDEVPDTRTILEIKEEFKRKKYEIHPHDWGVEDFTLMHCETALLEDCAQIRQYIGNRTR